MHNPLFSAPFPGLFSENRRDCFQRVSHARENLTRLSRPLLTLVILNELRGAAVVAGVLWGWL